MCILLVYAFSHEVYFLYTFSVPNYYYKKYTSVVYFLYTQCSILPIQVLYTKSIVDFDKGIYERFGLKNMTVRKLLSNKLVVMEEPLIKWL